MVLISPFGAIAIGAGSFELWSFGKLTDNLFRIASQPRLPHLLPRTVVRAVSLYRELYVSTRIWFGSSFGQFILILIGSSWVLPLVDSFSFCQVFVGVLFRFILSLSGFGLVPISFHSLYRNLIEFVSFSFCLGLVEFLFRLIHFLSVWFLMGSSFCWFILFLFGSWCHWLVILFLRIAN